MSAARLNSRALTVRGTLPQIGSFSLGGFLVSSLPAFGRPPWMKLSALPDLGYSVGAVGTKVGPSLVRQSPRVSWTRRPGRPPLARGSSDAPRARSLDVFFDQVTTPAASVWEEKGWTSFINV